MCANSHKEFLLLVIDRKAKKKSWRSLNQKLIFCSKMFKNLKMYNCATNHIVSCTSIIGILRKALDFKSNHIIFIITFLTKFVENRKCNFQGF